MSIINGGKTEKFIAKKAYLKYVGEYRAIKDNVVNKEPFYLTASSLDVDPRDYVWIGLPSHIFKEELDNLLEGCIEFVDRKLEEIITKENDHEGRIFRKS